MSTIYLSDSGSPMLGRGLELVRDNVLGGFILSPFKTPRRADFSRRGGRSREDAARCVRELVGEGAHVLFDSQTYAVDFPSANTFDTYNAWQLWGGIRGDLSTGPLRQEHVQRVLDRQHGLGVEFLVPTLRLDQPSTNRARRAIDLAQRGLGLESSAWLTIAGTPSFWASGAPLDVFVGELAQLRPGGFVLAVAREAIGCPAPGVTAEEVQGLCRSVYSLARRFSVVVSHGDFAALPAVAGGASGLGSGWDLRQRVLGADSYRAFTTIRRRGSRVTHGRLLAALKAREAEALRVRDATLSNRLVPGALPVGQREEVFHHLRMLKRVGDDVAGRAVGKPRADRLRWWYSRAARDFTAVESLLRLAFGRTDWIDPVQEGLELYANAEGW